MKSVNSVTDTGSIRVHSVWEMPDELFLKHLEKRHSIDFAKWNFPKIKHYSDAWIIPLRSYHEKLHELSIPGQYDHVHREI